MKEQIYNLRQQIAEIEKEKAAFQDHRNGQDFIFSVTCQFDNAINHLKSSLALLQTIQNFHY